MGIYLSIMAPAMNIAGASSSTARCSAKLGGKMAQNADDKRQSSPRISTTSTSSCFSSLGFGFLTFNTALSAYRARHDPWTVAFVLFVYFDLLAFLACLRVYQKRQAECCEKGGRLKVAIWVLANALNVAFAYRVAEVMPLALYVFVWAMSGFTAVVTFYGLFVCREPEDVAICHQNPKNNDAEEVSKLPPEERV